MKQTINIDIEVLPKELRLDTGICPDTGLPVYDVMYKEHLLKKTDVIKTDDAIYIQLSNSKEYLAFKEGSKYASEMDTPKWLVVNENNYIIDIFKSYELAKKALRFGWRLTSSFEYKGGDNYNE